MRVGNTKAATLEHSSGGGGQASRDEPKHTQKSEKKAEKNDDEEEKYTTKRCLAQMVFVVLALYLLHERNRAPSCGGAGCVRLTASSSNE